MPTSSFTNNIGIIVQLEKLIEPGAACEKITPGEF
jgi:hypothetical protein